MDIRTLERLSYRLQQGVWLVLHLFLLYWIVHVLKESGSLSVLAVLLHFLGMGIFGSLLIWGCSRWARFHS